MRYIKKPWTLCKDIAVLITSCSLLIRILSIGYLIGGFVMRFHEPLLKSGSIRLLNSVQIGSLPLGSFINALALSLIPAIIVNTVSTTVIFYGICRRNKGYLIASAVINLLMVVYNIIVISLLSWLLKEVHSYMYESLRQLYNREKSSFDSEMECCGFDIPDLSCTYSYDTSCSGYITETINTYGSAFIAVLVTNVIVSIIMIIGTEYLHRLQLALEKLEEPDLKNVLKEDEMHKLQNGICTNMCSFLRVHCSRNKLSAWFGCLMVLAMILDGGIILSIVFIRYNHYDITLTTDLYAISREYNINMGYMKDALLIAVICILVWSLIAKSMCFVGIYANRKSLFIIFMVSEIVLLTIQSVILIFASYLLRTLYCCFWNTIESCQFSYGNTTPIPICTTNWTNAARFIWISTGIIMFHIIYKVFMICLADRVYKQSVYTPVSAIPEKSQEKYGFFYNVYISIKRHPLTATLIGLSILITVVDLINVCGLLVIRYGYSSFTLLRKILDGITLGSLNMAANRDNSILMTLVGLSFSFFLQIGKFISLGLQKPKVTLLILWKEVLVIILLIATLGLISVQMKLVDCCRDVSENCLFNYGTNPLINFPYSNRNTSDLLCNGNNPNVLDAVRIQTFLMLGFTIVLILLQFACTSIGYVYFKRSQDGHLGVFKGVIELFKSMWFTIINNRFINEKKMPNYRKLFGIVCVLAGFGSVMEMAFTVSIYAYYFTEGDSSPLLQFLSWFSHYRYNMESLYKGVSYTLLVIIPLALGIRIIGIWWFLVKRTIVSFFTISAFTFCWTLGEVVVLRYASYILDMLCLEYSERIYIQSGVIIGYLVPHIILNITAMIILDAIYPHLKQDGDVRRFSMRLLLGLLQIIKKHSIASKIYIGIQTFSLILNATFWIGLILMGLIPGHIHMSNLMDALSGSHVSFITGNMKAIVLGTLYGLIGVIPLYSAVQSVGIFGVIKQKSRVLKLCQAMLVLSVLVDLVFLFLASLIQHFGYCACLDGSDCGEYKYSKTPQVCENTSLYFNSSGVLVAYMVTTIVLHIAGLLFTIKISRGLTTRIDVIDDKENLKENMEMVGSQ
ncbi:uncharacterized protein LOC125647885 isoform X2 [Ostrea edulis]|uniref:uncharacterized protein LOC125647885 isoform X2 n=1 Tax=Ostrea edulis TaxID=37623 RepID=UPI0024AFE2AE|nr:uncharacterized protein LOC125647885 isoform X2 [Ostrea edulis]